MYLDCGTLVQGQEGEALQLGLVDGGQPCQGAVWGNHQHQLILCIRHHLPRQPAFAATCWEQMLDEDPM